MVYGIDLQFRPRTSSRVYSVNSKNSSDAKICITGATQFQSHHQWKYLQVHPHQAWYSNIRGPLNGWKYKKLTIGLSGSRGSVMTKFLSIRSSVVAKSIPLRIPRVRSKSSWLSGRSYPSITTSGSNSDSGISSCINRCDFPIPRRDKNPDVRLLRVVDMRSCSDTPESFWWRKLGWGSLEPRWLCSLTLENFGDEIEWMPGSGDTNESAAIACVGGVTGGGFLKAPTSSVTDSVALSFCRAANKRIQSHKHSINQ